MSFATSKEKSVSEKNVLVEIDLGKEQGNWVNYRNGVWSWTFNTHKQEHTHAGYGYGNYLYGSYGYSGTFTSGIDLKPALIGSVYASGTEYTEQTTLVNCVETEESYFYDVTAFKLYVHTTDNNDIATYLMIVGFTHGVSNRAINLNNIYYEPRLTGVPVLGKTKDPLYFGVIKYDGGTLTLNNADGYCDDFKNYYTLGQPVTIKYGFDDEVYANYATLFKGYIENLELSYTECLIDLIDNKKKLSKVLPTHFFDQTTYSNLNKEDVGKPIPLVWGLCFNVPCICINRDEGGTPDWTFKVADVADHSYGISAVTAAYVDGVGGAGTVDSTTLMSGTFVIANADYSPGQKVTADVRGFIDSGSALIDDPLDVIEDILNTYLSIAYNATNFDQTEWAAAKADSLSSDIGLWVDEETEIIDLIEQISRSAFGNFIIKDDGKYTFRIFDSTDAASETLTKREILKEGGVSVVYGAEFLTSCNVSYGRNWSEDSSRWYNHTSLEADIFNRYRKYRSKDFDTLLALSASASTLATALMAYMRDIQAVITIQTSVQNIQLEIGDIVNFTIDRPDKAWMGATKVEIIGRDIDLLGNTVTLIGREV